MSEMSNEAVQASIEARGVRVGNTVKTAAGGVAVASTPFYVDTNSQVATGNIPFPIPLFAGATDTSFSALSVSGSATLSANEIMHQTLVQGSAGSLTTTGFIRVTITDNAGNLTNGAYYIPFGTLL